MKIHLFFGNDTSKLLALFNAFDANKKEFWPEINEQIPRTEFETADRVDELIKQNEDIAIVSHSEVFFLRIRRRVAEGTISYEDVSIHFEEEIIALTKTGGLNHWPKGFFNYTNDEFYELIQAKAKAIKVK